MRKVLFVLTIILIYLFVGCRTTQFCPKISIPEEPKYKDYKVDLNNNKLCIEGENLNNFLYNLNAQKEYKKLLLDLIKEYNEKYTK